MQDEMNDIQYTKPEDPDIVRVVRCKDCVWFHALGTCRNTDNGMEPDDYCSYGERKDG